MHKHTQQYASGNKRNSALVGVFFFSVVKKNMERFTNLHVILAQGPC